MTDRPRYYLTTAIAYANNKPGIHTLYEVIGADVIARWHRMLGDDTRFLTGTDEHSINIAQAAVDEGRPTREFVDEKVALFHSPRTPSGSARTGSSGRPTPITSGPRRRWSAGRTPTATSTSGTYEGWYCPNEGFRNATDVIETARGTICPNHPERPAPVADRAELVLPPVGLPGAPRAPLRRAPRLRPARLPAQRDARLHPRRPRGLLDQPRADARRLGHPVPDRRGRRRSPQREDGSWDPEAGMIYVWYDALINYITGAGFPDDPEAFAHWWPADLHVIGKDIARFHTIFWPAMLWSAGLEAPRQVWVHGWLLAAGGERMSKSRGNFLDPDDFVAAFGQDGARYVVLREVPFDRDAEVSWDSFVRRYNADLANDFGNLVNRTVSHDQPLSRRGAAGPARRRPSRRSPTAGPTRSGALRASGSRPACSHEALAELWEFVGARQQGRRRGAAVGPRQGREGRRRGRRRRAARRPRRPGRGLPAHRPGRGPVHARRPRRASSPSSAIDYPYGPDGNGGPPLLDELAWGAPRGRARSRDRPGAALPAARRRSRRRTDRPMRRSSTATATSTPTASRVTPTSSSAALASPASSGSSSRAGTSRRASARSRSCDRFPWLDAAVGVHPHDAAKVDDAGWAGIVAAGRGRPRGRDRRDRASTTTGSSARSPDQLANLRRNLALALETGKPAILHCRSADGRRDAQDALLAELRAAGVGDARWAAAFGDRPAGDHPLVLRARSTTAAR